MSNTATTIQTGQTLTARSACDHDCIFSAFVILRKGSFATVRVHGNEKRVKVKADFYGEFIHAMGKYSMCPIFRAEGGVQ